MTPDQAVRVLDSVFAVTDRNTLRDGILRLRELMRNPDTSTETIQAEWMALTTWAEAMRDERTSDETH